MVDRERNVIKHLSEGELDRLQAKADDIKEYKRLTFLTRLYNGATLAAAEDIGISQGTASNWVTRWNEGGLGKLTPNFGGGPPPKLDETEQQQLMNASAKANHGRNKRYNISLTRNLKSSIIRIISRRFWMNLGCTTQFLARNDLINQRIPKRLD